MNFRPLGRSCSLRAKAFLSGGANMDDEPNDDLLTRALAAYTSVVADPQKFGPEAAQLVAESRRSGNAEALVAALRAEAWYERTRLVNGRAKALLDEAVRVAQRHRLDDRLGEALVTRGAVNHELGRLPAARRDFGQAATLVPAGRSAELALQQAALHQNIGQLSEAAALYRKVLADPCSPADVRAKVANNLGDIEARRGHTDAALAYLDEAAAVAANVGPAIVGIVAETKAWVTVQTGRLMEGLRLFDDAAFLWETAGLPLGELYTEESDLLADLRLLAEASERAHEAARQFSRHGVPLMGAEAQLRVARLALLAGRHSEAAAAAAVARESFRQQRRTAWSARAVVIGIEARLRGGDVAAADLVAARRAATTLETLGSSLSAVDAYLTAGRVAAALGRRRPAVDNLQRASQLARRAPVLVRMKGRVAAALAAQLRRQDRSVLQHCRAGLADLSNHRAAFASMELRALASGHGAELGRVGLEVLLRSGSAARVLNWMERTRAAALFAVEPPATEGIEDELAAVRAIQADVLKARREHGVEPPELLTMQAAAEGRARRATWERRAGTETEDVALSLTELRSLLDGQVLVEYGRLDGRIFAAVLESKRVRLVDLGSFEPVEFEIDATLFALRRLARPRSPASLAAARASAEGGIRKLTALLVEPLRLPEHSGLVVAPFGELHRVPWAALHDLPVSVAPSGFFWARARRHRASPDGPTILVAGPGLTGATDEVEALRELHERPSVLVPPASTVAAVTGALAGATLAHLACHGRIRADNPMFSSLLLSDGPLTLHELDARGIAPHRIILAACESGADLSYEGDEMLGFVSALIARGTAGLVASAVMVPDVQAVPLMRRLHEHLRSGATLAVALHAARSSLDRDDHAAYVNWCAFNAFGAG